MITSAAVNLEYQPDPRSLAEKAYQILVRKIIRLELMPGEPSERRRTEQLVTSSSWLGNVQLATRSS